jgi:anaerobic ribonucleoside-triphosphate reductase activating protein
MTEDASVSDRGKPMTLRLLSVVPTSTTLSPFPATVIQAAGCRRACKGCVSVDSWAYDAGDDVGIDKLVPFIEANGPNLVGTGGEILDQPDAFVALLDALGPTPLVAVYTGYELDELQKDRRAAIARILERVDLISTGPFIAELAGPFPMAGSSNQRVVAMSGRVAVPEEWLGFEVRVHPDGSIDGTGIPPVADLMKRWRANASAAGVQLQRVAKTHVHFTERREPR